MAVARASPLGGKDGGRILTHGRRALGARQIVGVLAADGVALEILPKIDVPGADSSSGYGQIRQRLVHMLGVALDLDIAAGAMTELSWQKETMLEILIGLFARKLADEVRKGMPRRYLAHEDDLTAVRGQLDITRQFTNLIARPDRLACRYDDLSPDIVLNQIMKAAVERLVRVSTSVENQRRLRELAFFYDISSVLPSVLAWDNLTLDRTNSRWRELVELARLLLGDRFQNTSSGATRGFSLTFDTSRLFEAYVARQLKKALAGTDLTVHPQGGRLYCLEEAETGTGRFMTKPDILVKRRGVVELIIDTKWKRVARQMDDPKRGVSQSDIYQMVAYGQLYDCTDLLLLYPHHAELGSTVGVFGAHRITGTARLLRGATLGLHGDCKVELGALATIRPSSGPQSHQRPTSSDPQQNAD
ncbi:5-methylcytosine restriction system specificity protein McrC [Brevundimonas sp.]|uniref:McrC family protein n=1 Tax=Brevundimonas sp. TaxID=1871086 RepID=UPI0028AE5ED8|nr:restriction endonuclease [Brevundimonas sp.]